MVLTITNKRNNLSSAQGQAPNLRGAEHTNKNRIDDLSKDLRERINAVAQDQVNPARQSVGGAFNVDSLCTPISPPTKNSLFKDSAASSALLTKIPNTQPPKRDGSNSLLQKNVKEGGSTTGFAKSTEKGMSTTAPKSVDNAKLERQQPLDSTHAKVQELKSQAGKCYDYNRIEESDSFESVMEGLGDFCGQGQEGQCLGVDHYYSNPNTTVDNQMDQQQHQSPLFPRSHERFEDELKKLNHTIEKQQSKISSLKFHITYMKKVHEDEEARGKQFEKQLLLKKAEVVSTVQELVHKKAEVERIRQGLTREKKEKEDLARQIAEKNVKLLESEEKYDSFWDEKMSTINWLLDMIDELKSAKSKGEPKQTCGIKRAKIQHDSESVSHLQSSIQSILDADADSIKSQNLKRQVMRIQHLFQGDTNSIEGKKNRGEPSPTVGDSTHGEMKYN